jgi:hypothetical protein
VAISVVGVALAGALVASPAAATGDQGQRDQPLFGFSDGSPIFPYEGAADAATLAGLAADAGAEVVRYTVRWEEVQPLEPPASGPPLMDFTPVDELVAALRERDIRPLPMLLGAPGWAREPGCSGICPPAEEHFDAWRGLVRNTAARYPGSVALEIWNEPNLGAYWSGGPDPRAYARLYDAAHEATADLMPRTPLLVGGLALAEAAGPGPEGMPLDEWLRGFEAASDADGPRSQLAIHVYPGLGELGDVGPRGRFARTLDAARDAWSGPLWVTEFGASTTAPAPGGEPDGGTVSPELQAEAVTDGLRRLFAAPDVAAALVYTLVDRPPQPESSEEGFGLVGRGPEYTRKPAYCAVAGLRGDTEPDGCPAG